ncbi:MAG: hypothetical protein CL565_02100 [Alphaproteobacteria bacterium]|nr:hypothetical protein [Alphaproteobacteria bacterium]|tara:strand:+ start:356 stop:1375 length:1020 start_codon:yes stop_codon:yes gene_type:complete
MWDPVVNKPDGMTTHKFKTALKRNISYIHAPSLGPPKGNVIFGTGYGDSYLFHYETIKRFQEMGYTVWAFDWSGQGLSERYNTPDPDIVEDNSIPNHIMDLKDFTNKVVRQDNSDPVIYASHSMGGHIGMHVLKQSPKLFDSAVFITPLLDLDTHLAPRKTIKTLTQWGIRLGLKNKQIPSLENTFRKLTGQAANDNAGQYTSSRNNMRSLTLEYLRNQTPEAAVKLPTYGWLSNIFMSAEQMHKQNWFQTIQTPVLFITAGRDGIVDNTPTFKAAKEMPNATHRHYHIAEHAIFSASDDLYNSMWQTVDSYLSALNANSHFEKKRGEKKDFCPKCPNL